MPLRKERSTGARSGLDRTLSLCWTYLKMDPRSGSQPSVNERKSKTERAARRKVAVPPLEPLREPMPPPDTPSAPALPPDPAANGDEESLFAPRPDENGPSSPPLEAPEASLAPLAPAAETSPAVPPPPPAEETLSLEQRVRRLEDALAQLHEQHGIETRIAPQPSPRPAAPPVAATAALFDVGKRLFGAAAEAVTHAPPPSPAAAPPSSAGSGVLWLLWDTWAEARAIARMFVDPRYQLPWSSRLIPLVLLAAFLIPKKFWVPGAQIPFVGDWLLSAIIDLLLAFLLFKWLGHEARRYRQSSPDLPPSLRL